MSPGDASDAPRASDTRGVAQRLAPLTGARLALVTVLTAMAAIVYELLIGTLSTYLHGDSALQFSLTIGTFLAAMGLGAFLARDAGEGTHGAGLLQRLVWIEIAVATLGGLSALLLYSAYQVMPGAYLACMVSLVAAIGVLVGMELPILAALLREVGGVRGAFASALSLDYVGSLLGSLAFPFLLLPTVGTVKTALLLGGLNLAAVVLLLHGQPQARHRRQWFALAGAGLVLIAGLLLSARLVAWFEHRLYQDEVVWAETTRFQRIVVTRYRDDLRLYSDKELQFSSRDEYRYHESLIHPLLAAVAAPRRVLVVGGGDGLGVRELLKDPRVERIVLVDIDPAMTRLARSLPPLVALNGDALSDPRVATVHADGYRYLIDTRERFDAVVLDLPDPRTEAIARLYSREFYARLLQRLAPGGALVTQAGSPYYTRESYWCVVATLRAAGLQPVPYRVNVPAFGEWGFVLAARTPTGWGALRLDLPRRWLRQDTLRTATRFDADTAEPLGLPVSTFESPAVWRLYRQRVRYWRGGG